MLQPDGLTRLQQQQQPQRYGRNVEKCPHRTYGSTLSRQPTDTLKRSRSHPTEGGVANDSPHLKQAHCRSTARACRLAYPGASRSAHGNAMRTTSQPHEKGSERKRSQHEDKFPLTRIGCDSSQRRRSSSDDFGEARARTVGLEVFVKHHGHSTHEEPPHGCHVDAGIRQLYQPLILHAA